jgi:hypothetical protein
MKKRTRKSPRSKGNLIIAPETALTAENRYKNKLLMDQLPPDIMSFVLEHDNLDPQQMVYEGMIVQYTMIVRALRFLTMCENEGDIFASKYFANLMRAISQANTTLAGMAIQWRRLLADDILNEEQRLRVAKLQMEIKLLDKDTDRGNLKELVHTLKAAMEVEDD